MKQPSINQGLPVKKKTLLTAAFISPPFFMVKAEAGIVNFAQANPRASETSFFTIDAPEPFPTGTLQAQLLVLSAFVSSFIAWKFKRRTGKIMRRTAVVAWISCMENNLKGGEA
jgi:hypothetical protein